MIRLTVPFLAAVFCLACENIRRICECNIPAGPDMIAAASTNIDSFKIEHFQKAIVQYGFIANFGFHIFHDSADYITFLDKNFRLHSIDLNGEDSFSVNFPLLDYFTLRSGNFNVYADGRDLHILNDESAEYLHFDVSVRGREVKLVTKVDLSEIIGYPQTRINAAPFRKGFEVCKRILYVPFITSKRKYYLDTHTILRIDLEKGTSLKLAPLPANLNNCYMRDLTTNLTVRRNGDVFTIPSKSNIFQLSDTSGGLIASDTLPWKSEYLCYDLAREQDFAYDRKYSLTDEQNKLVFQDNWGNIFLFKRAKKENISHANTYWLITIDKELKVSHGGRVPVNIYEHFIYPYKNGFISISQDYKTAYLINTTMQ